MPSKTTPRWSGGIRAGACGFLLKGVTAETLVEAIRAVAAGGSFLYAPLAAGSDQSGALAEWRRDVLETPDRLTSREREVLKLLTSGISNPQIAAALNLGEGGVTDRTKAVLIAMRKQLV